MGTKYDKYINIHLHTWDNKSTCISKMKSFLPSSRRSSMYSSITAGGKVRAFNKWENVACHTNYSKQTLLSLKRNNTSINEHAPQTRKRPVYEWYSMQITLHEHCKTHRLPLHSGGGWLHLEGCPGTQRRTGSPWSSYPFMQEKRRVSPAWYTCFSELWMV